MAEDRPDQTSAGQPAGPTVPEQAVGAERVEVHHKHRPVHDWREFLSEILVIVLGVLIALGMDQFVDNLHWRHKVDQAEQNMRVEMARNRTNAAQFAILAPCTDAYLDRVRDDLMRHDAADLTRIHQLGEPFVTEAWTATAWDAAVASQIGDHMAADRFLNFAEAFRRAVLMRDIQFRLRDHYTAAMTGRFGLPDDKGRSDELTAEEYLRRDMVLARDITRDFIANTDALGVRPDPARVDIYRRKAAACLAALGPQASP